VREPGRAQGAIFHSDRLTARYSSTEFRTPPKALRIKQSMRRVDSALDKRRRRVALHQLQIGDRHPGPGHPRRGPAGPRSPTSATTTTTVHTRLLKHAPRTKPVSAVHPSPRSMKARSRGETSLLRTRGFEPTTTSCQASRFEACHLLSEPLVQGHKFLGPSWLAVDHHLPAETSSRRSRTLSSLVESSHCFRGVAK
jgi:hypothetical protein